MERWLAAVFGAIAVLWALQCARAYRGMSRMPRLGDAPPLPDTECSTVSILFAGRDEEKKLPGAFPTLLAQDYPNLEIIAVDDRSSDGTAQILDNAAARDSRLRVIHIGELPAGWLGKAHALNCAAEQARGEWLLFTDADVRFTPGVVRHAVALAQSGNIDHLTLLVRTDLEHFWEKVAVTFWSTGVVFSMQPWRVSDRRSSIYLGFGAFQLIRRSVYDAIGGYRRLAMEVVDDMKISKLVKRGGFHSAVARADDGVRIRWHDGLRNLVRGLTKNTFAAMSYSYAQAFGRTAGMLLIGLFPLAGVALFSGPLRASLAALLVLSVITHAAVARGIGISALYGATYPLGALILSYIVLRSALVTAWRGGVVWRGTFYPLPELRRGSV